MIDTQLRFLTCGSVDDGKSTLMGRLLYEVGAIFDDQLEAIRKDTKRYGTTGEALDFALLMDGLEAEREQAITIDVAYRYFSTAKRSFIAIDCPGHEQYTRNMATGASDADLAVILVDARKGSLIQTRRHATICSLMGLRNVIVAVNKMDLIDFDQLAFERIRDEFLAFARGLNFTSIQTIPVSARSGDNVVTRSSRMSWYEGGSLLEALENADPLAGQAAAPFRFPVQLVLRPNADFRGFAGRIASGEIAVGDEIVVASSGAHSRIAGIIGPNGETTRAGAGEAVTLRLTEEIDIARGDLLAPSRARAPLTDHFSAHLVWMSADACSAGRQYLMRIGTRWVGASITGIKHGLDVETLEQRPARGLSLNEIGVVEMSTVAQIAFDRYADNRVTGAFILVDRETNNTVAAGMIQEPLRRATNVHPELSLVDRAARAALKSQSARCVWFTGLSGAGKSTIAKELELALHRSGRHTMLLDGDNLRHGLNSDLGFTEMDRIENIRRAAEMAKLMTDAGLIVICALISPFRADRDMARALFGEGEFVEVFVDTPLEECIQRDRKGLYAKAIAGQIPNFTGISSPYEVPEQPEVHLRLVPGDREAVLRQQVQQVMARLNA